MRKELRSLEELRTHAGLILGKGERREEGPSSAVGVFKSKSATGGATHLIDVLPNLWLETACGKYDLSVNRC